MVQHSKMQIHYLRPPANLLRSKTASPPAATSLLALPPEIRQQIYDLVVINRPEHMDRRHQINIIPSYTAAQHSIQQQPALSCVCRTLRREVLPFYYAKNTFMISLDGVTVRKQGRTILNSDAYFLKWLRAIGQRRCEDIRAIAVYVHSWNLNSWPKEMALSRHLDLLMQELRWNGVKGIRRAALSEVK